MLNRNDEEQDIENEQDNRDDEYEIVNEDGPDLNMLNRNDEEQDIENETDDRDDDDEIVTEDGPDLNMLNRNDEEQDIENKQDKRDDDDDEIVTEDGPDLNMLNRNDEEQDIENEQDDRDDDDEIVTEDGPDDFLGSDLFTELPELKDTSMTSLNFNNMSFSDADCEKESFNTHDTFIDQFISWNHENTENVEHVQENCIPSRNFNNGTNIAVKFGSNIYPAVVSEWPWIMYYKYLKDGKWMDGGPTYTIAISDVVDTLDPPDITMEGRHLYYIFNGNDFKKGPKKIVDL
ncbi:unnamed protein product [Mytilus coruscus]|uniref:Uncharacterized protein n=1 Tax=Mytilus coruscus TaxID=42192 RepID=A0A6J8APH9_MYTCO|nr:unnamed protein product [Mytilus coruscus]